MNQKNAAFEQKVARAAQGLTREREIEKEKLTSININKYNIRQELNELKNHQQSQVTKTKSTHMLKTELHRQMLEKRDVRHVQVSQDAEQLRISKQLDEQHWVDEKTTQQKSK